MKKKAPQQSLRFAVLAADVALFSVRNKELVVRLVRVQRPPHFPDHKGLPGGLLLPEETAEEAAKRHIESKAKIRVSKIYAEQLFTFSEINRDPRGRVVAVAYLALVPWEELTAMEQNDLEDAWWQPVHAAHNLAYDHDRILHTAISRLRSRITYTTLISKIMPREFTLTELEKIYESVLAAALDKRNFRKKILKLGILSELPGKRQGGAFRPAQLYKFNSTKIREIEVL